MVEIEDGSVISVVEVDDLKTASPAKAFIDPEPPQSQNESPIFYEGRTSSGLTKGRQGKKNQLQGQLHRSGLRPSLNMMDTHWQPDLDGTLYCTLPSPLG